jgi:photosystem II stability/assembly factor-like uncharacterized protein
MRVLSGPAIYLSRSFRKVRPKSFLGALALGCFGVGSIIAAPHWDIQYHYLKTDSALTINDIVFPGVTRGIVCGYTADRQGKERPLVLLSSDGGQHWAETVVKETGLSLFFLDDSNGWMVTDKGIWSTVESGHTWTKLPKSPSGMLRVWFLDKKHGYAAGLQKRVYETSDAGVTWTLLPILSQVPSSTEFTTFGEIAFSGNNGLISGWYVPPEKGGPGWMEPEAAKKRRQQPNYTVLLQTKDVGKTWIKGEASLFGQATRVVLTAQGIGLGLIEFKDEFDYPSEVYRIQLSDGNNTRVYRSSDRAITDVRLFDGSNRAVIAGYETTGKIYRSPIPGKLKVLTSDDDMETWEEMPVDYRAVAHRAMIAGPDPSHLWIATDTGIILKLAVE